MVLDIYDASWDVLETLSKKGKLNASQIRNSSKIGSKTTLYRALDLLLDEELITINDEKIYSINSSEYFPQTKILKVYDEYDDISDNMGELLGFLNEKLKDHKPTLGISESDKKLVREQITKSPYFNLIEVFVRLFQLGSVMEFFINSAVFSKTIQHRAITLRRRNEKLISKYLELLRKKRTCFLGRNYHAYSN